MKNNIQNLKEVKSALSKASLTIQLHSTMNDTCTKTLDKINRASFILVDLIKEHE